MAPSNRGDNKRAKRYAVVFGKREGAAAVNYEDEEFPEVIPPSTGSVMDMQDHGKEEDSQIKSEIFEHIVDIERELIKLQKSYSGFPAAFVHIETLIDLLTVIKKGIKAHDVKKSKVKEVGFKPPITD